MELKGYAYIKKDADCKFAMGDGDEWQGRIVRVMEFNDNSKSALVINSKANGMATFDYDDIQLSFKCEEFSSVLIPPGLSTMEKSFEAMKRISRKGGYNDTVKKIVIANSLQKKKFDDELLFSKQ